jgi:DnaJ-domain-containing protein 1
MCQFTLLTTDMNDGALSVDPQQELALRQEELAALETDLSEQELAFVSLQGELRAFEQSYQRVVLSRRQELQRIEEQIQQYTLALQAMKHFYPSSRLKQLYREVAKRIHPDLATDPLEYERRQELMAAANQAYEQGDEAGLRQILIAWEQSPESVQGEGSAADLERINRKIQQIRRRIEYLQQETEALRHSDLYQLMDKAEAAKTHGRDLLLELATLIEDEIVMALQRLVELRAHLKQ